MDNGWIKLHRKLLDSEIFASQIGLKIWLWSLMKASHKKRFIPIRIGKGETTVAVEKGSFIFGRNSASRELNINGSTVYKWMQKLQDMGMISIESNNQYSIITICNYVDYQKNEKDEVTAIEQPLDNQVTATQQPRDTYKKVKNDKNDKNTDTKVSLSNAEHSTQEKLNYDEVINFFNSKTNGVFGLVRLPISDKRKSAIRARIREHGKIAFGEVVAKATNSDFLKGSTRFKATFDWIIKPDNFSKILEGNYDNRKNNENNGNNGITAKQQQRQQVVRDVHQDVLDEILYGENK